jgi:predicted RNase H-like HicB family nuclease
LAIQAKIMQMKDSARYVKIVEWSEEDQCFIGSSPGLFYGGCHGDDEKAVFAELCEIVDEAIAEYHKDGKPLPLPLVERTMPARRLPLLEGITTDKAQTGNYA